MGSKLLPMSLAELCVHALLLEEAVVHTATQNTPTPVPPA